MKLIIECELSEIVLSFDSDFVPMKGDEIEILGEFATVTGRVVLKSVKEKTITTIRLHTDYRTNFEDHPLDCSKTCKMAKRCDC